MRQTMHRIREEIENYTEPVDIPISLLFTAILLFLSFVGSSKLGDMFVQARAGGIVYSGYVSTTYYGFPFAMVGILTPVGSRQNMLADLYVLWEGNSKIIILWGGLFLDLALFFSLVFVVIYSYRRFIKRQAI